MIKIIDFGIVVVNSNILLMSGEEVKIYVRNSKKYGKILNIPPTIQAA